VTMLTSPVPPFPWRAIKIGESFFVPGRNSQTLKGCVRHMQDRKFSFKQISLRGQVGCKVTRVEASTTLDRLRAEKERALIQLRRAEDRIRKIDAAMVAEKLRLVGPCGDGGRMTQDSIGGET
jgi:hypothetical protein